MAVVGSAEVIVRAITTKVKDDIRKAFEDARPEVAKQGEAAGKDYSSSFGRALNANLTSETRSAAKNASQAVQQELDRGLDSAGRSAARNAGQKMEDELRKSGSRGGKGFVSDFVDTVQGDFTSAINRLFTLASLFDVFAPAIANLVGAISAVVSGLFAMGSAASYAAGAIAVLPGLLGAAAQAFGAIKLGSLGVGDAIKAGAKAQQAAAGAAGAGAKASGQSVAAARRLQKAQDALTAAQKAAREAQDALNDAQDRAKDGLEEQQEAERRLAAEQQNRTKTLADPNASAQNGADAQKGVDDAARAAENLGRARADAQDEVRKAAEKNDAAQAALAKAQKDRDKAQKAAQTGGVSSPAVKAAQAYQQALSQLTPEAQAFVKQVLEMRAAFKVVGDAISREMFPPLTEALQLIGDSRFFDILEKNLSKTGGIVGNIGLEFAKAFTTKTNMNRFSKYLSNNNDILDTLITKTKDGTTPMTSLTNIILKLGLAIQPLTKRFVEWAGGMVTAFDAAHGVGDLTKFFNRAGDSAAQLGRIFGNLFDILGSLGKAANPAGQGLLDSFEKATQKLSEFLETPKQQKILKEFFEDAADNMRDISDLLASISGEFLALGDNKGIGNFAKALQPAVDIMGDIGDKLTDGDLGTKLGELGTAVAEMIDSFVQTGQMSVFVDTLTLIVNIVAKVVKAVTSFPGAGAFLAFLAVFRAARFAANIAGFGKSFDKLRGAIFKLARAPFAAIGKKIKSAFGRGPAQTADPLPENSTADDEAAAHRQGFDIGEELVKGIADGIRVNGKIVDTALDNLFLKLHTDFEIAVKTFGQSMGDDIVDGLALGIRTNIAKAAAAATELGDETIDALKLRLGIHSPSTVFADAGDDSADGYVLGLRQNLAQAYKAGASLGDAAADGARASSAQVATASRGAAAPARAAAGAAASPVVVPAVANVGGKLDDTAKKSGKLAGAFGKLGGAFKGVGAGAMALVGGPIGALFIAIPLLVAAFTTLYKKSPEFRKFVDGIVKAVKPLIDVIGKVLLKVLNGLFAWINDHMPQIKAVFSTVFDGISKFVTGVVVPAFKVFIDIVGKVVSFVKDHWRILLPIIAGPIGLAVALVTKYWDQFKFALNLVWKAVQLAFKLIKGYYTNILFPVFRAILRVGKSVFSGIRSAVNTTKTVIGNVFGGIRKIWNSVLKPVFNSIKNVAVSAFGRVKSAVNSMKNAFSNAKNVIGAAKDGLVSIFNGIKNAAKKPIKFVIDTVWNKGLVAMADKIPGVNAGGWKVSTKGWATGGWTGPGGKYKPAGIVHADEFVVKKSSRRSIEKMYPGLLSYINRMGKLPAGHAAGGLVRGAAYSGAIPPSLRGLRGYGIGDIVDGAKDKVTDAGKGILKLGGKTIKWTKDVVKGGITWTKEKATAAYKAIKKFLTFVTGLPGSIANNMSSSWGQLFQSVPKGAANKVVDKINSLVPDALPGVPLGHPFGNVQFREMGGRVRAGSPYVVGEKRPELFIPDSSGTIMPNLSRLTSSNAIADILKELNSQGESSGGSSTTSTNNSGPRTLNVNVNNPAPERSSQSVAKAVRSKAIAHGWSL